jgi:hypothetical protein
MTQPAGQVPEVAESAIPTGSATSSSIPQQLRVLTTFEYQPATGTMQQVSSQVVAAMDARTGLPVQLATYDQMEDMLTLLRALLRIEVTILSTMEIDGSQSNYTIDEFLREADEEG